MISNDDRGIAVVTYSGSLQKSVGFIPIGTSQGSESDLEEEVFGIPVAIGLPPYGLDHVVHALDPAWRRWGTSLGRRCPSDASLSCCRRREVLGLSRILCKWNSQS